MPAREAPPPELRDAPLGHPTAYPDTYTPSLLFAVPRAAQRKALGLTDALPFTGRDQWTAYDFTWLDANGRPRVAIATLDFPADSPSLIESKSMKLYLGSFAQSRYSSASEIAARVACDLGARVEAKVAVDLHEPASFAAMRLAELAGESLDDQEVAWEEGDIASDALRTSGDDVVDESLTTNLFRSLCPVTGQPDIASIQIAYRGRCIDRAALLRYLLSYRQHASFHEQCVERVFVDVSTHCRPTTLSVHARFTRRGGIDINPLRASAGTNPQLNVRTARQ
jgi:7-cyano-7-deazaguanine reductase